MRTVFITGGSRGIGAAAVRAFSAAGYRVAFTYLRSADRAAALARETGALALCADLRSPDQAAAAAGAALAALRRVDALVNNAGAAQFGLLTDLTDQGWRDAMAINLDSAFYVTRALLPGMISRRSGSVVNISSMWGLVGASCEVAYSAAKAGLIGLTRALAKEVGPSGVRVNCVAPGAIDTDMNQALDAGSRAALIDQTPLRRLGTPDEVAALILYLCSDAASFLTGQVISPNGGYVI
ncbi:MAG: 3-oxoacyl-ACP reductase FabG [Clostridiales bacterium]|nr:3-oxoacyl-ACP reductase FabG [Clostridiales bacterium]